MKTLQDSLDKRLLEWGLTLKYTLCNEYGKLALIKVSDKVDFFILIDTPTYCMAECNKKVTRHVDFSPSNRFKRYHESLNHGMSGTLEEAGNKVYLILKGEDLVSEEYTEYILDEPVSDFPIYYPVIRLSYFTHNTKVSKDLVDLEFKVLRNLVAKDILDELFKFIEFLEELLKLEEFEESGRIMQIVSDYAARFGVSIDTDSSDWKSALDSGLTELNAFLTKEILTVKTSLENNDHMTHLNFYNSLRCTDELNEIKSILI